MTRVVFSLAVAFWASTAVAVEPTLSKLIEFRGPCDASAAVAVDSRRFVVANNEDNIIRMYETPTDGGSSSASDRTPVAEFDLTSFLDVDREHPEVDIEGATRVADRIYWISSHCRTTKGKRRASRYRFFATDLEIDGSQVNLKPVGRPYEKLAEDLANDAGWSAYDLRAALERAHGERDTFNIEGLTGTPAGPLWIGLRSPVKNGRALLVSLENAAEVILSQAAPRIGPPREINLGGGGIRGLEYWPARDTYIVLSGPAIGGEARFNIALWSGQDRDAPRLLTKLKLGDLHPETVVVQEDLRRVLVLSDDGSRDIAARSSRNVECKDLEPEKQSFRGVWLDLGK